MTKRASPAMTLRTPGISSSWTRQNRTCFILGWILLRRAGLTPQQRLSVLSACGNSLHFDLVEVALRDQEEELLAGASGEAGQSRRSYWVEEAGFWLQAPDGPDDNNLDWSESVFWGGEVSPLEAEPWWEEDNAE